jgi:hypothetical protein
MQCFWLFRPVLFGGLEMLWMNPNWLRSSFPDRLLKCALNLNTANGKGLVLVYPRFYLGNYTCKYALAQETGWREDMQAKSTETGFLLLLGLLEIMTSRNG